MGRVANYRSKINGLIDIFEGKIDNLGQYEDDFNEIFLSPDEEDAKFSYEYSIKNLETVIRLLDALKASGVEEGPGFCNKIAEATGYSRNRVSDMLSGNAPLNHRFIKAICAAYNTLEEYILEGRGKMIQTIATESHNSLAINEAVRLLTQMTEPERLRAVALLLEMGQKKK